MKSEQFSASLRAYARLLHQFGCVEPAHELDVLAKALDRGDETVGAIVRKIVKGRRLTGYVGKHPSRLKSSLEQIAATAKATGAPKFAGDCETLGSILTGEGGATTDWFVDAAMRSLEAVQAPPPSRPPALDQTLVTELADRLRAASSDNATFDAIVGEFKASPRLSKAILTAVANAYLGVENRAYKSKSEILKVIANHQLQAAIQVSRERRALPVS